jgi:hypothetical protein
MSRHAKTRKLIETARQVLEREHPMTVRQVYYQLVSRQVIENNRCQYQAVSKALVAARKEGVIPWDWVEDRLRRPRSVSMWSGLSEFAADAAASFHLDVWRTQPSYLEVWLEKDALSGIFEDVLRPYGVTLNVGRGYDGWDSIHNAAQRLSSSDTVLYFGDFDPSGEDMVRSLRDRLAFFERDPIVIKSALTSEDIERYRLPPDFAKATDSRRNAFVAVHGDVSVELDALPGDALRERLINEVESRMDLIALAQLRQVEESERARLTAALEATS